MTHLKVGDNAPSFSGTDQNGKQHSLADYKGKKLVVFFYPKANTPGCTAEACNLNENIEYLTKQGFTILGISADPVKNQKKFHDKFGFKYDLLADENHEVCEKFGVWQLKKFMGKEFMGIVRTTFLFDENSVCTEVIEKVETKNHAAQILK